MARALGISPGSLRHYERKGLLPGVTRTSSGYRNYSAEDIKQVRRILAARAMGFSLAQIARWLQPKHLEQHLASMHELAAARVSEISSEICRLKQNARKLRRLLDAIQSQLERSATND